MKAEFIFSIFIKEKESRYAEKTDRDHIYR